MSWGFRVIKYSIIFADLDLMVRTGQVNDFRSGCWVLRRVAVGVVLHCRIQESMGPSNEKTGSTDSTTVHDTKATSSKTDNQEEGHGSGGQKGEAKGRQDLVAQPEGKRGRKKGKAKMKVVLKPMDSLQLQDDGAGQWEWELRGFAPGSQLMKFDNCRLTLGTVHGLIKEAVTELEVR